MSLELPKTDEMDMELVDDPCTISEYYKDKVIFMTGFTGFMGKVLVEKLLWSCKDLKHIYVLVRPKKGLSPQERIHTICKLPIFDRLREREGEKFLSKLVALSGDTSLPGLGLSEEDRLLLRETNILFNAAASVRFDDPLPSAVKINTSSVKALLDLCLEMPNLESLIHLSTAYTNCDVTNGELIEEKIYPPMADWRDTIKVADKIDPYTLSVLSYKYSQHMPNTYVFTKRLGENVLTDYIDRVPIAIIRPSIVISTWEEPFPGWIDNLNGPVGLLSGCGVGVVRTTLCESSISPDFVPVDAANKCILATPWFMANAKRPRNLLIMQLCASDLSITNKDLIRLGSRLIEEHPMKFMLWKPSTHVTNSKFWFTINAILFQLIPGIIIDVLLKLAGKKQMLWKIQIRIYVAMMALMHFTTTHFKFKVNNAKALSNTILQKDYEEFFYYKELIDYYSFFSIATVCFQKYMLNQKEEDYPKARQTYKMFSIADKVVKTLFWSLLIWFCYKHQVVSRLFYFVSSGLTDLIYISPEILFK